MKRSLASGFTLLETLIVLVLFGLIVVAVLPLVQLGADQVARARRAEVSQSAVALLDSILFNVLAFAQPNLPRSADIHPIEGRQDSVIFTAIAPAVIGGGLARFRLELSPTSRALQLSWSSTEGVEQTVDLVTGVEAVAFEYDIASDGEVPRHWATELQGTESRILAVRLKVTAESIGELSRVVPLFIDRNRSCVLDTVTFDCRPGA